MNGDIHKALIEIVDIASDISMTPENRYHNPLFYAVSSSDMEKLKSAVKNWLTVLQETNDKLIKANSDV